MVECLSSMSTLRLFAFSLCCLMFCSCMSQQLQSESGLYDVQLIHTAKVPVDGIWIRNESSPAPRQAEGHLYIAPLQVSAVQDDYPKLAPLLVEEMRRLLTTKMEKALADANAANQTQWTLTDDPSRANVRIDLAVVSLKTQKPWLHVFSKVIGLFAPRGVGDAIDFIAKGDITLEGTIRDARSGQLIVAFKDSNRAHLRFYHKDTYRRTGNVDANLRLWARKLAAFCRDCACDRMGNKTLRERIEGRSTREVIKARLD